MQTQRPTSTLFIAALSALALFGLSLTYAHAGARLVAQATTSKRTISVDSKGNTVITIKQPNVTRIKAVTRHIFRGGVVKGKKHGPPGRSLMVYTRGHFNSMIQYRENFTKELKQSAKNL